MLLLSLSRLHSSLFPFILDPRNFNAISSLRLHFHLSQSPLQCAYSFQYLYLLFFIIVCHLLDTQRFNTYSFTLFPSSSVSINLLFLYYFPFSYVIFFPHRTNRSSKLQCLSSFSSIYFSLSPSLYLPFLTFIFYLFFHLDSPSRLSNLRFFSLVASMFASHISFLPSIFFFLSLSFNLCFYLLSIFTFFLHLRDPQSLISFPPSPSPSPTSLYLLKCTSFL